MSYPRELEEYDDEELKAEIERRGEAAKKKLCSYCNRKITASACRFPERHKGKRVHRDEPRLVIGDTAYTLTEAFCEGAIAYHHGVPWNVGNPYHEDDDRHEQWSDGHGIASGDEDEKVKFTEAQAKKALKAARKRRL